MKKILILVLGLVLALSALFAKYHRRDSHLPVTQATLFPQAAAGYEPPLKAEQFQHLSWPQASGIWKIMVAASLAQAGAEKYAIESRIDGFLHLKVLNADRNFVYALAWLEGAKMTDDSEEITAFSNLFNSTAVKVRLRRDGQLAEIMYPDFVPQQDRNDMRRAFNLLDFCVRDKTNYSSPAFGAVSDAGRLLARYRRVGDDLIIRTNFIHGKPSHAGTAQLIQSKYEAQLGPLWLQRFSGGETNYMFYENKHELTVQIRVEAEFVSFEENGAERFSGLKFTSVPSPAAGKSTREMLKSKEPSSSYEEIIERVQNASHPPFEKLAETVDDFIEWLDFHPGTGSAEVQGTLLGHPDAYTSGFVIGCLGRSSDPAAAMVISAVLGDPNAYTPETLIQTIHAVGAHNIGTAADNLIDLIQNGVDNEDLGLNVSATALLALGSLAAKNPAFIPQVLEFSMPRLQSQQPSENLLALRTLTNARQFDERTVYEQVNLLLKSEDSQVRQEAYEFLNDEPPEPPPTATPQ